jgi:hypothetical protein
MTKQHPITPPPELVQEWVNLLPQGSSKAFTVAAQWGADQELEACCEWMAEETPFSYINALSEARRPKPPSLKEQAFMALESLQHRTTDPNIVGPIRRALEALPE